MRSAHFRLPLLAGSLAFLACAEPPPPNYTFGGAPSHINIAGNGGSTTPGGHTSLDGGYPDGGSVDGGLPTAPCGSDADGTANGPPSGLVISELGVRNPGFIELYNRNSSSVDLSTYSLAGSLSGQLATGNLAAAAHTLVPATLSPTSGELALLFDVDGGTQMVFYACWGSQSETTLQDQALTADLWETPGLCPSSPPVGDSLHLTGPGAFPASWNASTPTPDGCTE